MRSIPVIVLLLLVCTAAAGSRDLRVADLSGDARDTGGAAVVFLQVTRESDLTLDDIQKVIEEFDCFQQAPDRPGTNPFTNEPMVFSGEGRAIYVDKGEPIGNFALEDGRLLFTGVPEAVVTQVAELLSANVLPWDSS
jgi:hypothetical protein